MEKQTISERVLAVREKLGFTRKEFAEKLGITADELRNIESNRLKKPEQKESLYRNIATEFGVSLEWLKNGGDEKDMFGGSDRDEITSAFGELAARKDPTIDGFIQFLHSRTPDELDFLARQLQEFAEIIKAAKAQKKED